MSKSPILFSSDDDDDESNQEAEILLKFKKMLQGLPPPSSVTMSKLSVSEMLEKYKENESLFTVTLNHLDSCQRFSCKYSTPLVYYSNSSKISEEIANLTQKVQNRYIFSETMSSCNIWFDTVVKTNSAKKRRSRRNELGMSPGSRLSHLARRRQVFSSENLQQLANIESRHQIEIKKDSALKTRISDSNKRVEKINSFKRALFLSPEDDDSKKVNFSSQTIKKNSFINGNKSVEESCRTFGVSKQFSQNHTGGPFRKRARIQSKESSGHWPRRALTFSEEDSNKCQETNLRNAKVISEVQLSLHHKSKLLWAVSLTLKEKNISSKDPEFKTCASALFMICRKNLGKILSSKTEGRTSEKMLQFAREQIGGVFKKLGISNNVGSKEATNVDVSANLSDSSEQTKESLDKIIKPGENCFYNNDSFSKRNSEDEGVINELLRVKRFSGKFLCEKVMRVHDSDTIFLEEIDNYLELSYLGKSEIVLIYSRFKKLGEEVTTNLHHRFEKSKILEGFPELNFNPFVDRIFHVFSSLKDEKMSFEDVLDFASAFSDDCPIDVKAQWAFMMFDFDGDELLNQNDIAEIVTRLTKSVENSKEESHCLSEDETKKVAEIVFNNVVLCHSEGITCMEFVNEVKKNPEFECSFRMKFH